jgi:hypothetical protein
VDPSHHMVVFHLLGESSQQVPSEILGFSCTLLQRAHVPKLEPVVTPHIAHEG